jgi:deoxycytidine triphosphate deaminase
MYETKFFQPFFDGRIKQELFLFHKFKIGMNHTQTVTQFSLIHLLGKAEYRRRMATDPFVPHMLQGTNLKIEAAAVSGG